MIRLKKRIRTKFQEQQSTKLRRDIDVLKTRLESQLCYRNPDGEKPPNDKLEWVLRQLIHTQQDVSALRTRVEQMILPEDLMGQLATNVTSLVGLKEAITLRHRPIKYIWITLLVLNILASAYYGYETTSEYFSQPTATKVQLLRPKKYPYPYLVLCPSNWLDYDKAMATGQSMESLAYSIGYMDDLTGSSLDISDISKGQREFLDFYAKASFTSLVEYFQSITVDITKTETWEEFSEATNSSFWCRGCTDAKPLVILVEEHMCFAFEIQEVESKYYRFWTTMPRVAMKVVDRSNNTFPMVEWDVYLMPDVRISHPRLSTLTVPPNTAATVRFSSRRFLSIADPNTPCQEDELTPEGEVYSADLCISRCLSKKINKTLGCHLFLHSANDVQHPTEFCHLHENYPGRNYTYANIAFDKEELATTAKQGISCVVRCPHECDRSINTISLGSLWRVTLSGEEFGKKVDRANVSLILIEIDYTAISDGGIMTLTEVSTLSFSSMISNIGGALGLFVGGTIMTLFQIILVCVGYAFEKRKAYVKNDQVIRVQLEKAQSVQP